MDTSGQNDVLGEFRIITAHSGDPTAIHLPSRCLIHSQVNPLQEACDIVNAQLTGTSAATLLLGGGLGYLAEAILEIRDANHEIWVIEPDVILHQLGQLHRDQATYYRSQRIHTRFVSTMAQMSRCIKEIPEDVEWMISPYFLRLQRTECTALGGLVSITRTEIASRQTYRHLLETSHRENERHLMRMLPVSSVRLGDQKLVCVCGAGPSLSECLPVLRKQREQAVIVSVSGAVPALLSEGVIPDWVIALEARESIVSDLADLPKGTKLIVFPATHPAVVENVHLFESYRGDGVNSLSTRGGSSLIPALDFALRASQAKIALIGADLGYQSGTYAAGSRRTVPPEYDGRSAPPKFAAMRAGIEGLLRPPCCREREILHVLTKGPALHGTMKVSPIEFERMMYENSTSEMIHD